MFTRQLLLLISLLFVASFAWKQGSATKPNQKGFNEAFRINAQLDQWEKSHIIPQADPNTQNDPNLIKFKNQIFQERKNFAQQWVEKMNNGIQSQDQVEYFVDGAGKVQYKSNKKNKKQTTVDL